MIKGDTPEAPCFNNPEETGYRETPHQWHELAIKSFFYRLLMAEERVAVEACAACGALRKVQRQTT